MRIPETGAGARSIEGHSSVQRLPKAVESVIWLLCHYPDTKEIDERVKKAAALHFEIGFPIWLYGSASARYPQAVERHIKGKLIARGVVPQQVQCSGDLADVGPSLDTVQEALNVAADAKKRGIKRIICVSNRLQLLQVRALLRHEEIVFQWVATPLRDWRWWYVLGRLVLIPLAYAGVGQRFVPLVFIRWARASFTVWPF